MVDKGKYQAYYNRVSNRTLWFLQHYLFDIPRHPVFDDTFRDAWLAYTDVNVTFAEACEAEADDGAEVYVQDYHLSLVPAMLRERRPDVRISFFLHCPWVNPAYYAVLPRRRQRAAGRDPRRRPGRVPGPALGGELPALLRRGRLRRRPRQGPSPWTTAAR